MTLPELSADASPEFTDAATCKEWLEHVPLANVATAQANLLEQLQEFNRFPTAAAPRLAVLEGLREAVHFVQIEQAKRFANRALPMSEQEKTAFDTTIALWDQMCAGYQRCLDGAEDAVKDFLNRDIQDTSPRVAYARGVLMGLCNPNELAQRQLTFVAYLLERWGGKLEVETKPVDEGEGVPPLVADLAGDACPERGTTASTTPPRAPRYLDTRKLSKSLRNRVALLRKGESPAKLALGEDCVQPSCEQLLVYLYRQWCQAKSPRTMDRRTASAPAEACTELAGIHYYVSGRVFRPPGGEQTELTQKQREEIATFGRVSTREDDDYSNAHGFAVEQWYVEDESSQGMRMVRKAKEPGKRLAHGQLIGVRPGDGKQFMLAQVRWLMGADNGDLHAGVKLLPGLPSPLAVRPTGLNVQQDSWVPALALSAVPALESPPSLVLPHGWFKPKRIVELYAERSSKAMLTEVIERGVDFERVAFQPVP